MNALEQIQMYCMELHTKNKIKKWKTSRKLEWFNEAFNFRVRKKVERSQNSFRVKNNSRKRKKVEKGVGQKGDQKRNRKSFLLFYIDEKK